VSLSGKSKSCGRKRERHGQHARPEPVSLDDFAQLYGFPALARRRRESLPRHALPNLADAIQEKCEKLLEQVCMRCRLSSSSNFQVQVGDPTVSTWNWNWNL